MNPYAAGGALILLIGSHLYAYSTGSDSKRLEMENGILKDNAALIEKLKKKMIEQQDAVNTQVENYYNVVAQMGVANDEIATYKNKLENEVSRNECKPESGSTDAPISNPVPATIRLHNFTIEKQAGVPKSGRIVRITERGNGLGTTEYLTKELVRVKAKANALAGMIKTSECFTVENNDG